MPLTVAVTSRRAASFMIRESPMERDSFCAILMQTSTSPGCGKRQAWPSVFSVQNDMKDSGWSVLQSLTFVMALLCALMLTRDRLQGQAAESAAIRESLAVTSSIFEGWTPASIW